MQQTNPSWTQILSAVLVFWLGSTDDVVPIWRPANDNHPPEPPPAASVKSVAYA